MRIAVTGGIGSGKSAAMEILRDAGYPTYSADKIVSDLYEGGEVVKKIGLIAPGTVCGGSVDKSALKTKIFSDAAVKREIERYIHPLAAKKIIELTKKDRVSFTEVPLLFESGLDSMFDAVFVVMKNKADRIKAVKIRDGLKEDMINKIILSQYDYENIDKNAHTLIYNDGSLADLKKSVLKRVREIEVDI